MILIVLALIGAIAGGLIGFLVADALPATAIGAVIGLAFASALAVATPRRRGEEPPPQVFEQE